ncbi:MAG: RNA polymerase sigma factor [Ilumatobacteraceae bacterium]
MSAPDGQVISDSFVDPLQFALIFDRHIDEVRRFVVRRLGPSRADDVVSEVFRVAFERRATFEVAAVSALPWLYGIATNLVRRDHRSHARRLAALHRADGHRTVVNDPLLDAAARVDANAEVRGLGAALLALGDDEREVLLLVAWEQLTPTEAAAVLGIPAATARTRLRRARMRVRSSLNTNHDRETEEVATDAN